MKINYLLWKPFLEIECILAPNFDDTTNAGMGKPNQVINYRDDFH